MGWWSYSKLASMQSLLPSGAPFVCLTATASLDTKSKVCRLLNMIDPTVISVSPDRGNIRYNCLHCKGDRFAWLLEELRFKQLDTTKAIVFCRSIARCALMYQTFDLGLKEDGYVPRGKFGIVCALFAMYHAKITDNEKKLVLESFSVAGGNYRVLFCTVALVWELISPMSTESSMMDHLQALSNMSKKQGEEVVMGKDVKLCYIRSQASLKGRLAKI